MKKQPRPETGSPHSSIPEETIFRNYINSSRDAIFFLSKTDGVSYANPACKEQFGYSLLEILESADFPESMLTAEHRQEYSQIWHDYITRDIVPALPFEWTWKKKDGTVVHTEATFVNITNEQGESIGLQFIVRDITKAALAERRNTLFIRVGRQLSTAITVEEAAKIVTEAADELFGWDAVTFDMYNQENNTVVSLLNIDTINGKRVTIPPKLTSSAPTPRMQRVITSGGYVRNSTTPEDIAADLYRFGDISRPSESIMIVPIRNNGKTVGIFSIQSYKKNAYFAESLPIFQALADFCGGALERIQVREELHASEEKFRRLFKHVPDGVYQSTRNGGFIAVNNALVSMLGYDSMEELLSIDIERDLYGSAEQRNTFLEILDREHILRNNELHWRKKDGSQITLLENAHVVHDAEGKVSFYEGTLTDITDLKNIQRALMESERKYRALIEGMNEGVVQVDNDDIIHYVNDRYCELVGYAREELIGKCAHKLLHDDEGKKLILMKNSLRITGVSDKYEIPVRKKSGELITVLISGSPIYDERGDIVGSIGINLDITERKRAEEELAEQKTFLRQIIDLNPNFIFSKDRNGRFTLVNRAIADAYGTTVEELVGKRDSDFNTDTEQVEHFLTDDLKVMDSGKELVIPEEVITDASGKIRWLQTIKRPIMSADGSINQILGVASDISERKKIEEELRQSELRFRKIFEEGPIGMTLVNLDLQMIDANEAICKMLGYTRTELLALSIADISHPDDYQKDLDLAIKILSGEQLSYSLEKRYIKKDKTIIWGRLTGSVVRDANGASLYGIGMVEDITEQKRTEEMLRLLESAVQQANESITITSAELNEPGPRIVFVNPAFTRMTGYTFEEAVGNTPRILQGPKTDRAVLNRLRNELLLGGEFHGETVNYKKDGTEFYLEWHIAPIKNADGTLTHYLAVQRDITARKASDEALRKSEKRYRLFFEEDLTGDYIALPDGTIVECNPAFQRMFGFTSKEEAIGFDIKKLFPSNEAYHEFLQRILKEKKQENNELELRQCNGDELSVVQNVIGIFNKHGELLRFKGYLFDNTERKRLEKQLLHSQKMESIGTLAAGLAHNFNNIMSIILGYATALKAGSASPLKVAESVDAISLAVKRGTGLVRQLTTFARSDQPVLMSVNVNTMLQEIGKIVRETFPENISCKLNINPDAVSILADPNELHQALLNLCVNARDAMPYGGILTMSSLPLSGKELRTLYPEAAAERYVRISVSDTGAGLDEAAKEHLYEPFYTTKEIGKGTGLGLAVVYGIVKNHHGFIEVESEPGKGATFHLYFRSQASIEKFVDEEPKSLRDVQGGPETILVVEDEEMLLDLVKGLLEIKGYSVLTATDGMEALQLYTKNHHTISLVLSDMGLPQLGGWDLLKHIREINPEAKVILASGYLDPSLRENMIKSGAVDFIQKPYEPDFILNKIRNVIDGNDVLEI